MIRHFSLLPAATKKKVSRRSLVSRTAFFNYDFFFGSRYRGVALSEANAFGPQSRLRVRGGLKRDLLLNAPSSLEGEVIETRYFLLCERVFSALDEPQKMFREDSSRRKTVTRNSVAHSGSFGIYLSFEAACREDIFNPSGTLAFKTKNTV